MEHEPITGSSNIAAVGYDEAASALEVVFSNGGTYRYADVPKNVYEGLMAATSKGKFLATEIKGHYDYTKIS